MPPFVELLAKAKEKSTGELLRQAPQYVRDVLRTRAIAGYYWSTLHATPRKRQHRRNTAVRRLRDTDTVLFLCHGNICRSPFAERYLRKQLIDRGIDMVTVDTAGLVDLNDPRSPPNARRTAEMYGVNLAEHRSEKVTAASIEAADLVFVMDYRNYHTTVTRFPHAAEKVFLLRIFESGPRMQIRDPHGYSQSVFSTVYDDIRSCLTILVNEYASQSPAVEGGI